MESAWRAIVIYIALLVVFRLTGKRALSQVTIFDFVLLLIISEAAQQGLVGDDYSVTGAIVVIVTLIVTDITLSLLKQWSPKLGEVIDGAPLLLIDQGQILKERMDKERVSEDEVSDAARELRGLERIEQVKYAVLEQDGQISIIPWEQPGTSAHAARPDVSDG